MIARETVEEKIYDCLKSMNIDFEMEDVKKVSEVCLEDLITYAKKDPSCGGNAAIVLDSNRSFLAVMLYRVANFYYYQKGDKNSAIKISEYAKVNSGIEIHPGAKIGKRFVVDHGTGTVIGETTVIGDDCYLLQNVILGAHVITGHVMHDRHPKLGNNVEIGAFTKVLGNIRIGNNVKISPNCVITRDIDDDTSIIVASYYQIEKRKSGLRYTGYRILDKDIVVYIDGLQAEGVDTVKYESEQGESEATQIEKDSIILPYAIDKRNIKLKMYKNKEWFNELIVNV
ncbi:serine O-acetyltransferase [Pseudobutyrivibrio ruminis]|uniref:serine O-acetyltransferase n=1 Tax=Pseudobutyrivibrio ruminis TaxID=46206 RepID=UPI001A9A30D5|nr:serine O-acetyltransferase [Pseudobutyrivibrio ruminis]